MEIYRDYIAGVQHAKPVFTTLNVDDPLSLVWERDNPFDPKAIRINHPKSGQKLGYVKRIDNPLIHSSLEDGMKLSAKLTFISPLDPDGRPACKTYESLVVAIFAEPQLTDEEPPVQTDAPISEGGQ